LFSMDMKRVYKEREGCTMKTKISCCLFYYKIIRNVPRATVIVFPITLHAKVLRIHVPVMVTNILNDKTDYNVSVLKTFHALGAAFIH